MNKLRIDFQVPEIISIKFSTGTDMDAILAQVANGLKSQGRKVMGMVQKRGEEKEGCVCREMHLTDLSTGLSRQISEARGPEARGCHLDWQAITEIAQILEENLDQHTDFLIINRFGRSESEGRGFRDVIEKALSLDIPVIVAYRAEYANEWASFHGGMAVECMPDARELEALCSPKNYTKSSIKTSKMN